jgi:methyltransferase FkbM-like protein
VEAAPEGQGYDVEVVRFDDFVALAGRTLAIKIDVERYERKVLAGMARTLRDNRGIVQIEVLEAREETIQLMTAAGFRLAQDFGPSRFPERLSGFRSAANCRQPTNRSNSPIIAAPISAVLTTLAPSDLMSAVRSPFASVAAMAASS